MDIPRTLPSFTIPVLVSLFCLSCDCIKFGISTYLLQKRGDVMIVHISTTHELLVHVSRHDPFQFSHPCIAISKNHIKIRMFCLNKAFTSHWTTRNIQDPRHLNNAIKHEHYPTPTIEDVATRLKNARVFMVLDAKSGLWQVALDDTSSLLTISNTPFGQCHWKRMPFSVKPEWVHQKFERSRSHWWRTFWSGVLEILKRKLLKITSETWTPSWKEQERRII